MTYLVVYDITNNKKRSKVAKVLQQYGGIRLQKSVFFIDLSQSGLSGLEQNLQNIWLKPKHSPDQLLIVRIHRSAFNKMKIIGQQFDPILALGNAKTLII